MNDPAGDFERDRWGHPLIVPPGGGRPVPYVRASSAAKVVEDTYNLEMWARRNVIFGMAHDRSLVARVLALGGEPSVWDKATKNAANAIHEDAQAVAKSHQAADIGSALHKLTEYPDRGELVAAGPYEADLAAYTETVADAGFAVDPGLIECRLVCDPLQMAGSADRILTRSSDGVRLIADIKTGEQVDFGGLGWSAQLAAYAHGELYDTARAVRLPTPPIDRTTGIIIHLPAGQGRCILYSVDLVAGYRAAQFANEIRAMRKVSQRWINPLELERSVEAHPAARAETERRRVVLLERYHDLTAEQRERFRAAAVDPADLDAVDVTLRRVVQSQFVGDEGAVVDNDTVAGLAALVAALPEADRDRLNAIAREAHATVGSINMKMLASERRWHIARALHDWACAGWDEEMFRAGCAFVTGDGACQQPGVTLGQIVGLLTIDQARRLAEVAAALGERFVADFTSGELRLVAT